MRKNIFKAGAAVMAAAMVMMTPMTAKADGIVVKDGETCTIPIYASTGWPDFKEIVGDVTATFVDQTDVFKDCYPVGVVDDPSPVMPLPDGYEGKSVAVMYGGYVGAYFWDVEVAGLKVDNTYEFTVDYNGTSYKDCAVYGTEYSTGVGCIVAVPKGYDGVMKINVYGAKIENGKAVKDETKCWTYYLQGGPAASAQQPAPEQQPIAEQPAPAEQQSTAEQPVPAPETAIQQPAPELDATMQQPAQSYQGNTYTVKKDDNLSKIAQELYGDKEMWKAIYELNKGLIKNPNIIYANMELMLP